MRHLIEEVDWWFLLVGLITIGGLCAVLLIPVFVPMGIVQNLAVVLGIGCLVLLVCRAIIKRAYVDEKDVSECQ